MAPIIPGLTDHEIPALLVAAAEAGGEHLGARLDRHPEDVRHARRLDVGVELGQLAFVIAVWAALAALLRLRIPQPFWARAMAPYAIGSVAMFWMIQRIDAFLE
jgi:hypothetical protein